MAAPGWRDSRDGCREGGKIAAARAPRREMPGAKGAAQCATFSNPIAATGSNTGLIRRYEMIDGKRYIGPVLLVCLAFFFGSSTFEVDFS